MKIRMHNKLLNNLLSPSVLRINSFLYKGPPCISDLCAILIRFRLRLVAVTSDLEKSNLMVQLSQSVIAFRMITYVSNNLFLPVSAVHVYCDAQVPIK